MRSSFPSWDRALAALATLGALAALSYPAAPVIRAQVRDARVLVQGREAVADEVLVKYRDGRVSTHAAIERQLQARESEPVGRRGLRRVRSRRLSTEQLLARLRQQPDVEYAEPNYILYAQTTPNDPQFNALWGLFNTGTNTVGGGGTAGADIDAPTAWNITTGSRAYVIGVVDTGVDYTHPDLAANMWSAPYQFQVTIGGQTITCQAGTRGFNAITRTCDPMDDNNHGTHVAGTIGAVGNNGVGMVGVNWTASMMGLKFLGSNGSGSTANAINAIEFAIQTRALLGANANIRVLNNSWGGGGSQALLDAINAANAADILFVAAAGNSASNNDTTPTYPASYTAPNIVTVAATTNQDQRASFSNYGQASVHLAAPGQAIYSTVRQSAYSSFQGTSMAAPHVAGAAILALTACELTTATLKTLILSSVDAVPALVPVTSTGGRLNVGSMMQNCPYPKVTTVTVAADKVSPQVPNTTITWTATATGGDAPLEYKWMLHDGSAYTSLTGWTTVNTFAWTPSVTNSAYSVSVRVRSAWNSGAAEAISANVPFAIQPVVTNLAIAANLTPPQAVGTPVTWTATATGGQAPLQYRWLVHDGSAYTVVADWGASNTFVWTPQTANDNFAVVARARSAGNTGVSEASSPSTAFAIKAKVTAVSVAADKAAPQAPNTTVTWTATATGGVGPLEYKWMLYDGSTYTSLTNWAASNTYAWTPSTSNSAYAVSVRVRSAWNTGAAEAISSNAAFAIRPVVTSVSLGPNLAAPQAVGTSVTWMAGAVGGQSPYQYRWLLYDGSAYTVLAEWGASNTYVWTPQTANDNYVVVARARSAGSAGAAEASSTTGAFAIKAKVTSVSISPDKAAPQGPNTTITWTASPVGGVGPREYKWMLHDGSNYISLTAWTTDATYAWTPLTSNSAYALSVRVRSAWNTGAAEAISANVPFAIRPVVTSVGLTADLSAPQSAGTPVTWTATANGGQAPYQYRWFLYDGTSNTALTDWGASNTFVWTPMSANANYVIIARARSAGSTGAAEASSTTGAFAITP